MARLIINKTWDVDGALTDVTTWKLSDDTGTYGVKRTDTDAVLVADGTDLTRTATGTYKYDSSGAGDAIPDSTPIRIAHEVVYGGRTYRWTTDMTTAAAEGPMGAQGLTFADLYGAVGLKLFNTTTPAGDDLTTAKRIVNLGLRHFLSERDWAFLSPAATLAVSEGDATTDLPAEFDYIIEPFRFDPGADLGRGPLRETTWGYIRYQRAVSGDRSSIPEVFAIVPKTFAAGTGQRHEVHWWPLANAGYTMHYRYRVRLADLSADADLTPGGAEHSMAIRQACLMMAEAEQGQTAGTHHQLYYGSAGLEGALARSIRLDNDHQPQNLGENTDGSDKAGLVRTAIAQNTWSHA